MNFLADARTFFESFSERSFSYQKFRELQLENAGLRNEIKLFKNSPLSANREFDYRTAEIFSRYPFDERGTVVINLGGEDGMKEGLPVLAKEGVLFGKIKSVKRTQSEVLTFFDSSWRSGVSVGEAGVKAVLRGGAAPVLEFIESEQGIKTGDRVLNISPEFPLRLLVGELGEIKKSPRDVWFAADIKTDYEIESLNEVLVLTDFP